MLKLIKSTGQPEMSVKISHSHGAIELLGLDMCHFQWEEQLIFKSSTKKMWFYMGGINKRQVRSKRNGNR